MIKTGENAYRLLLALSEGEKRFNELLREVKKASLARELTELEKMKYIKRNVIVETRPPTTLYSITKLGRDFLSGKAAEHVPKLTLELSRLKEIIPDEVKKIKNSL